VDSYVLAWGAGIGDVVLSTPMLVSLKTTAPTQKIIAIGNAGNRQILLWLADLGFVDEVITLPSTLPGVIKLFSKLSLKFRARFVILHTVKSAKIPWLLSPLIHLRRKSIGFRIRGRLEKLITGFDQTLIPDDVALRDAYASMGETLSGQSSSNIVEQARQVISSWTLKRSEHRGKTDTDITIGLHLGTGPGVVVKSLNRDRWSPLFESLKKRNSRFLLFGGPDEPSDLPRIWDDSVDQSLIGKPGLADFTAALSSCDLFIANDGGPMHLAGLLGIPTIAFFGASDPARQHPMTDRFFVIEPGCWCQHTSRSVGEIACPNPDGPICRDMVIDSNILNNVNKWLDAELAK